MTASDAPGPSPSGSLSGGHGPYHHIVVGTDGSPGAARAVAHAAELAVSCDARLTVVSAFTRVEATPGTLAPVAEPPDAFVAAAAAQDHVVAAQEVASRIGVGSVGGRTDPGDPASVLVDLAGDIGADLIVVGSRGMSGASRFLGSVPNRVSHRAPCDVIVVHTAD